MLFYSILNTGAASLTSAYSSLNEMKCDSNLSPPLYTSTLNDWVSDASGKSCCGLISYIALLNAFMNANCILFVYSSINGHISEHVELSPVALEASVFLADKSEPWNLSNIQCSSFYSMLGSSCLRNFCTKLSALTPKFFLVASGLPSRNELARHGSAFDTQSIYRIEVSDDSI